jgi:Protein of unknown function (DUF3048) N-terminal domain/Protein of unknown function (DUF3048) C-terminal domain
MAKHAKKKQRSSTRWPLILVALVVIGGGVYFVGTRTSSVTATTTSTAPKTSVIAPLTGLVDATGTSVTRSALTVKIENTPDALPQWGVDQADVVYEEIVNGGITRLAAVFNSQVPVKIGPVRSVRPTDTQVVWPLGGIFAYSGGAQYAVDSISQAPVKLIDESSAGAAMFRDPTRQAPHNLYARGAGLFAFGGTPTPPPALFRYATGAVAKRWPLVSHFVVPFPSIYPVTWDWNKKTASYDRTLFGQADITGTGVRESPKNVVVMFVNYVNGIGTMNSYGDLQSGGQVEVFTQGHEITGTWSRSSKSSPIVYHDSSGRVITMTPGQTWVELLNDGATVTTTK